MKWPRKTRGRYGAGLWWTSLVLLGFSCTPDEPGPELSVSQTENTEQRKPSEVLDSLDNAVAGSAQMANAVKDIRYILEAHQFEAAGKTTDAVKSWRNAVRIADDGFGEMAFEGWVKAQAQVLVNKGLKEIEIRDFARAILKETTGGSDSVYMKKKNLQTESAVVQRLADMKLKGVKEPKASEAINPDYDPPSEPDFATVLKKDPRLVDLAERRCKASTRQKSRWESWSASVPVTHQNYWKALSAQCEGEVVPVIEALEKAMGELQDNRQMAHLTIEVGFRLAVLQRRNDRRAQAAETYKKLLEIWQISSLTPTSTGMKLEEFHKRKINDALWGARYRSLIGDYEGAKAYAKRGLTYIANAFNSGRTLKKKFKRELAELRAEGYHVLSFRVAIEQGEYEKALSLSRLALDTPNLDKKWEERLHWFSGFYEFLNSDYEAAKRTWENLLTKSKEDATRARLYFWLAKTYDRLNKGAESRFYLQALTEDYPVSYYAVVASEQAGLPGAKAWHKGFEPLNSLNEKLGKRTDYNLRNIRQDREMGRLLTRAEVLLAARLPEYARLATKHLGYRMSRKYILRSHVGPFVYLSRLHYAAGDFLRAISVTTLLANEMDHFWKNWPEQILVYFPQPYKDHYATYAKRDGLDAELLMAISRQESTFTADVTSFAGAIGLMQLMPATARTYASRAGVDAAGIPESLKTPNTNIALGSAYLKELGSRYQQQPAAVFGGYNAGEYAVDIWMKRRNHSDPLVFVEMIPFGETKGYIKNVWRNRRVYRFMTSTAQDLAPNPVPPTSASAPAFGKPKGNVAHGVLRRGRPASL